LLPEKANANLVLGLDVEKNIKHTFIILVRQEKEMEERMTEVMMFGFLRMTIIILY
jgi:hypothetical protein